MQKYPSDGLDSHGLFDGKLDLAEESVFVTTIGAIVKRTDRPTEEHRK